MPEQESAWQAEISYEVAQDRYPEVVETVMAKLRRGTSTRGRKGEARLLNQDARPESLSWALQWDLSSRRMDEFLSSECPDQSLMTLTVDQRVEMRLHGLKLPILVGRIGEWEGASVLGMGHGTPVEVRRMIEEVSTEEFEDDQRWLALTDGERVEEAKAALAEEEAEHRREIRRQARKAFYDPFKEILEEIVVAADHPDIILDDLSRTLRGTIQKLASEWTGDKSEVG